MSRKEDHDVATVLCTLLGENFNTDWEKFYKRCIRVDKDGGRSFCLDSSLIVTPCRDDKKSFPELEIPSKAPIFVGGGAVVLKCKPPGVDCYFVLKVARPSLFDDPCTRPIEFEATITEYVTHAPLSHQNVIRVMAGGILEVNALEPKKDREITNCPAMLIEWLEESSPFGKYLVKKCQSHTDVLELITQTFRGLQYLHRKDLIHWDLKSDNILVDKFGTPKIADLGNSKSLASKVNEGSFLHVQSTEWNMPKKLTKKITRGKAYDPRRARVELGKDDLFWNSEWLDVWMLCRELDRFFYHYQYPKSKEDEEALGDIGIDEIEKFLKRCFSDKNPNAKFALRCIQSIIKRIVEEDCPSSTGIVVSSENILRDLSRIEPEFGAAQGIPELVSIPQSVMRLPGSGNMAYTHRVGRLFNSMPVQRLSRHCQLGSLVHVFPGASHRRSEHAAGVMSVVIDFVRALYSDRTDTYWRLTMSERDVRALIVAGLLHDVGHVAFGHFLEENRELFARRMHEDYVIEMLDPRRVSRFGEKTRERIIQDRENIREELDNHWTNYDENVDEFMEFVAEIIAEKDESSSIPCVSEESGEIQQMTARQIKLSVLRSIISSPIDADKLDYLIRDAHHCGVKYALGIDKERFLQSLTTVVECASDSEFRPCVAVTQKGILPVETVLLARFQMFSAVYWQHTARAETVMLQFVVGEYLCFGQEDVDISIFENRFDELMCAFRERSDSHALIWLKGEIGSISCGSEITRKRLIRVVDSLLERQRIYWMGCELSYQEKGDRGLLGQYASLRSEYGEELRKMPEDKCTEKGLELFKERRYIHEKAGIYVKERMKSIGVEDYDLEVGDCLVDITGASKEQSSGIFIKEGDIAVHLEEISPVVAAVEKNFIYWGRKLRLFVAPHIAKLAEDSGVTRSDFQKGCKQALRSLIKGELDQVELPLGDED